MKAPAFWNQGEAGLLGWLLSPLGLIYGMATALRMRRKGLRLPIPVIAVGNYVAGGAGKTPTALAIARSLHAAGRKPVFLTRGYGGTLRGPILVDPKKHDAAAIGDEALLLAEAAPTIVAADRAAGGPLAAQLGDVLILDDALQNARLHRDIIIAVIDGAFGAGNGLSIPAGPLRAPLALQRGLVSMELVIGGTPGGEELAASPPRYAGALETDKATLEALRCKPLLAVAGIGRPEKFFSHLRSSGLTLAGARAFADHHPYTQAEMKALRAEAQSLGARLCTTAKDAVRMADLVRHWEADERPVVIPVTLDAHAFLNAVQQRLAALQR